MQSGSGWPYINFSELNMDWIFHVLIPEVKSLKESYDNIQEIVRNVTQENYNQWKAELQTEMSRLQTQITQANERWKQTFAAQNAAWQQQAQNTLNTRFSEYVTTTNAAIEVWEHDAYERLTQLINSFAESITEAEANAKAYADRLNAELRGYVEQQLHFLNDEIAATNLKLELQVNALNTKIAQLKSDMAEWQQQMQAEMDSFKQDVNSEVSEFEDRVEQKINQHKEWVQQQLVSINNNIMEQVRLLNERISKLTAADIGAIDPITGEEEDVQFVLRHMFDVFSEYNGCITAGEYKQLEITAGEYKEKYNYNAILYSVASYWLLKIRKWERPAFYYNGEYVTPAELEQRLMDYITKAAVDAELADYALTNDVDQKLAQYIKTKDMISYLATTLENYVTYNDLQSTLQDYARPEDLQQLQAELNQKATQEQLESLRQSVYNEFDNYAKVSELPDFSEFLKSSEAADTFATLDDLNKYALKTELPDVSGLLSKAEAADQYALKTELPDVSELLSKAEAADQYALKTELPDVSGLLSKAEAADQYVLSTRFESEMQEQNRQIDVIGNRQEALSGSILDVSDSNNNNATNIIKLQNDKQNRYITASLDIEGNEEVACTARALSLSGRLFFKGTVNRTFGNNGTIYLSAFPNTAPDESSAWATGRILFESNRLQYAVLSLAEIPANQKSNWDILNVNIYEGRLSWEIQKNIIFQRPVIATVYSTNGRFSTSGILTFDYQHKVNKLYLVVTILFSNPLTTEQANEIFIYLSTYDSALTR